MALHLPFVILGSGIGVVVVGGGSILNDLLQGKPIDWKTAGSAAAGGAVAGGLIVATFGLAAPAAGGTLAIGGLSAGQVTVGTTVAMTGGGYTYQNLDNQLHDRPWHESTLETSLEWGSNGLVGGASLVASPARQVVKEAAKGTWAGYVKLLSHNKAWVAIPTKSATGAVLVGGSDYVAQSSVGDGELDKRRLAMMTLFGALWSGPQGHYWYRYLSNRFKPVFVPSLGRDAVTWKIALKRMALDQATMAPLSTGVYFAYSNLVADGKSPAEAWEAIKEIYPNAMAWNWGVWPGIQLLNQMFVPPDIQPALMNSLGLVWTYFLSSWAQENGEPPASGTAPGATPAAKAEGLGLTQALAQGGVASGWPRTGRVNTERGSLRVRATPRGEVLAKAPRGSLLTVMGPAADGWYPVTLNAKPAYVSAEFVSFEKAQLTPLEAHVASGFYPRVQQAVEQLERRIRRTTGEERRAQELLFPQALEARDHLDAKEIASHDSRRVEVATRRIKARVLRLKRRLSPSPQQELDLQRSEALLILARAASQALSPHFSQDAPRGE